MKRKHLFFLFTLFLLLPQQTKPQIFWFDSSKKLVLGCALVTGAVVGVGTYFISKEKYDRPQQKREKGFFAAIVGLIGGAIGGVVSYYTTPDSSLRSGHNMINSLEQNIDFQNFINAHSWQELEKDCIDKEYYLYVLAQKLASIKNKLRRAISYFKSAFNVLKEQMPEKSYRNLLKAEQYTEKINARLVQVKQHPKYLKHEKGYKKEQAKLRELRIKQQRVEAELAKARNKNKPQIHIHQQRRPGRYPDSYIDEWSL